MLTQDLPSRCMLSSSFVFQGIADHQHDTQLIELLSLSDVTDFLAGVAFVKQSGVRRIADALGRVGNKAAFFVGIRNEITSYQGITSLLNTGANVWAVDTATHRRVYHPKLYLSLSAEMALAVVGSANLTAGGLGLNVEASARLSFDLSNKADLKTVTDVKRTFDDLPTQFPKHVFKITSEAAAAKLLNEGRLVDESQQIANPPSGVLVKDRSDDLAPMKLRTRAVDVLKGRDKAKSGAPSQKRILVMAGFRLVWTSNPLSERDLNIPTGPKTNATGSMGMKRGAWEEDIDHRHYFREVVFAACHWEIDPGNTRWERASIVAELKVKGIWHGHFAFRLSHNRDKNSRTYAQKNFMTHFSWGDAKPLIARGDLLGRQLSLYRDDADPARPRYLIEID